MIDGGLADQVVLRFVHFRMTTVYENERRVNSSAFYHVDESGRGFSVFFRESTDVGKALHRFAGFGVAEIRLSDLEVLGFIVTRSPGDGNIEGDHADVTPPNDWNNAKYRKQAKALTSFARIVIEPNNPDS